MSAVISVICSPLPAADPVLSYLRKGGGKEITCVQEKEREKERSSFLLGCVEERNKNLRADALLVGRKKKGKEEVVVAAVEEEEQKSGRKIP